MAGPESLPAQLLAFLLESAVLSADSYKHFLLFSSSFHSFPSHMLSHTLGTFLPAVIPADLLLFPVPLPFALSPQASSSESPRLSCSCCPCPQAPRGAHFPDTGRHPPEVCLLKPGGGVFSQFHGPEYYFCLRKPPPHWGKEVTNFLAKSSQEHLLKGEKRETYL